MEKYRRRCLELHGRPELDKLVVDIFCDSNAWVNPDSLAQTLEFCMYGDDPTGFLKKHGLQTSSVCGATWLPGSLVYHCRDCQVDDTCVICSSCYKNSNHEGHDCYYSISSGGSCDCGDAEAWNPKGFCPSHGPRATSESEQSSVLPSAVTSSVHIVMSRTLDVLLDVLLDSLGSRTTALRLKECAALLDRLPSRKATACCARLLTWMLNTCDYGDAFRAFITLPLLEEDKLCPGQSRLATLCKLEHAPMMELVHKIFLKLMGYAKFKYEFYVLFVKLFPSLPASRSHYDLRSLSVQLFTVPSLTVIMTKEHGLLSMLVDEFLSVFHPALTTTSPPALKCDHPVLDRTQYYLLFRELRYVLAHREIVQYVIRDDPSLLDKFLTLLQWGQYMAPLTRVVRGAHVEYDDRTFQASFTFEMHLLPMLTYLMSGGGSDDIQLLSDALGHGLTAFLHWMREKHIRAPESNPKRHLLDVSVHPFLQRAIASALRQIYRAIEGQPQTDAVPTPLALLYDDARRRSHPVEEIPHVLLWHLVEGPVRGLAYCAQVRSGLWKRNGFMSAQRVELFHDTSFRATGYFLDILMIQSGVSFLGPSAVLEMILTRFGLNHWLSPTVCCAVSAQQIPYENERNLCTEMLTLLLTLVLERSHWLPNDRAKLRREVLALLFSTAQVAHSRLDALNRGERAEANEDIDAVLSEVANFHPPQNETPGRYSLKTALWSEFEPFSALFSPTERQKAIENYGTHVASQKGGGTVNVSTNDASTQSGSHVFLLPLSHLPPTVPLGMLAAATLLTCRTAHWVFYHVLCHSLAGVQGANDASTQESVVYSEQSLFLCLHLLSLSIDAAEQAGSNGPATPVPGHIEEKHARTTAKLDCFPSLWDIRKNAIAPLPAPCCFRFEKKKEAKDSRKYSILQLLILLFQHADTAFVQPILKQLLTRFFRANAANANVCRSLGFAVDEASAAASTPSPTSATADAKKDAARKRQAAILAQFAKQQAAFTASAAEEDDEDDQQDPIAPSPTTDIEVDVCVLCHEDIDISDEAHQGALVGVLQKSSVVGIADGTSHVTCTLPAQPLVLSPESPFTCTSGVHIKFCRHALHVSCHERYVASLAQRSVDHSVMEAGHSVFLQFDEFLCPLCRQLSNCLVPFVPGNTWADLLEGSKSRANSLDASSSVDIPQLLTEKRQLQQSPERGDALAAAAHDRWALDPHGWTLDSSTMLRALYRFAERVAPASMHPGEAARRTAFEKACDGLLKIISRTLDSSEHTSPVLAPCALFRYTLAATELASRDVVFSASASADAHIASSTVMHLRALFRCLYVQTRRSPLSPDDSMLRRTMCFLEELLGTKNAKGAHGHGAAFVLLSQDLFGLLADWMLVQPSLVNEVEFHDVVGLLYLACVCQGVLAFLCAPSAEPTTATPTTTSPTATTTTPKGTSTTTTTTTTTTTEGTSSATTTMADGTSSATTTATTTDDHEGGTSSTTTSNTGATTDASGRACAHTSDFHHLVRTIHHLLHHHPRAHATTTSAEAAAAAAAVAAAFGCAQAGGAGGGGGGGSDDDGGDGDGGAGGGDNGAAGGDGDGGAAGTRMDEAGGVCGDSEGGERGGGGSAGEGGSATVAMEDTCRSDGPPCDRAKKGDRLLEDPTGCCFCEGLVDDAAAVSSVSRRVVPLLRRVVLLHRVLFGEQTLLYGSIAESEFGRLLETLQLPTLDHCLRNVGLLEVPSLVRAWCESLLRSPSPTVPVCSGDQFRLFPLKYQLKDVIEECQLPCESCEQNIRKPCICLVCGFKLCENRNCPRAHDIIMHAMGCASGFGCFLFPNKAKVSLIGASREVRYFSPYLDSHGEEDRAMSRGKPLFLSGRYDQLRQLWVTHSLVDTLSRLSYQQHNQFFLF